MQMVACKACASVKPDPSKVTWFQGEAKRHQMVCPAAYICRMQCIMLSALRYHMQCIMLHTPYAVHHAVCSQMALAQQNGRLHQVSHVTCTSHMSHQQHHATKHFDCELACSSNNTPQLLQLSRHPGVVTYTQQHSCNFAGWRVNGWVEPKVVAS